MMPQPTVSIFETGSLITVRRNTYSGIAKGGPGGPREKIKIFSRASRRRLLRKVAQLDRDTRPLFLTLTYPSEYPNDPDEWKRHLNNLWAKRLKRSFPSAGYIWRLEFQKRGAPHFHLILYGIDTPIKEFRRWLAETWYDVVASGDEKHRRAGTSADQTRSVRGTMIYLAKEMAKRKQARLPEEFSEGVGRWWGVKHKECLPWSSLTHRTITDQSADRLIRLMRRHARSKGREYHTLSVFCDGPFWSERLDDILELDQEKEAPSFPLARLALVEASMRTN